MMKTCLIRMFGLVILCFAVVLPSTALGAPDGDEEFVEPTEKQYELNDEALSQMSNGEYAKAASLLQESLHIQPLNITYLNLGRSYQKMDRCEDARAALEKVASAPRVKKPPPELIEQKASEYLAEIGETGCAAALEDEPLGTALGPYQSSNSTTVAWASLGAGGALLGVAILFQLRAAGLRDDIRTLEADEDGVTAETTRAAALDKKRQADTLSTVAVSTGVTGLVFATVGSILLSTRKSDSKSALRLNARPGGGEVVWTLRF